jgi:processive 1,2-diacylglycerol beta-glucosyltransferase
MICLILNLNYRDEWGDYPGDGVKVMPNHKRILILSVAIGAGHLKTGEALCRTYQESFQGEACHLDFLRYALPRISGLVETTYDLTTKYIPPLYKWLYYLEDHPQSLLQSWESRIAIHRYCQMIQQFQPDAIIATHSFPAVVASQMFSRFPIPNAVVLTDYISHHIWVNPNTQLYFVAHAGMVDELKAAGVSTEQIKVTGIPVRPAFKKSFCKQKLRQHWGLDPDRFTVLLMNGGQAIGPMARVIRDLSEFRGKMQLIVITGNNQRLYEKLPHYLRKLDLAGIVLPFVANMEEYMAGSDLLISKAGGLTVTEALCIGLPMVVVKPTPGQEDGNTRFLEKCGAGVYVKRKNSLAGIIRDLLGDPAKLEQMHQWALQVAKPDATEAILSTIEEII